MAADEQNKTRKQ